MPISARRTVGAVVARARALFPPRCPPASGPGGSLPTARAPGVLSSHLAALPPAVALFPPRCPPGVGVSGGSACGTRIKSLYSITASETSSWFGKKSEGFGGVEAGSRFVPARPSPSSPPRSVRKLPVQPKKDPQRFRSKPGGARVGRRVEPGRRWRKGTPARHTRLGGGQTLSFTEVLVRFRSDSCSK